MIYDQLENISREALSIASSTKDLAPKMRAHYFLWKLVQKEEEQGAAEKLKTNEYLILKDSMKDLDLARQVERLQFEIEIERKERENELLKVNQAKTAITVEQQKLQNTILIIIVGFVSVLGLIQWQSSKKRREVNETLAQQNQFIQNQLSRNHRTK